VGFQGGLVVPKKESCPPIRYVNVSVSEHGDEEGQQGWLGGPTDLATHQGAGLVIDPVGLGYSYPLLDCAGVLDGHSVLAVARTGSEKSNWARSIHPGSSHVNLHIHNGIFLCGSFHQTVRYQ
jgi:hypothetical protein